MGSWPAPQRLILWWLIHNTGPGGCMGSGRTFDFMLGELPSSAGGSRRWSWSVCKDIESFTGQRRRCRALQADGTSCSALRVLLFNWCWCWLFQQPFFFCLLFSFPKTGVCAGWGSGVGSKSQRWFESHSYAVWEGLMALAPDSQTCLSGRIAGWKLSSSKVDLNQ